MPIERQRQPCRRVSCFLNKVTSGSSGIYISTRTWGVRNHIIADGCFYPSWNFSAQRAESQQPWTSLNHRLWDPIVRPTSLGESQSWDMRGKSRSSSLQLLAAWRHGRHSSAVWCTAGHCPVSPRALEKARARRRPRASQVPSADPRRSSKLGHGGRQRRRRSLTKGALGPRPVEWFAPNPTHPLIFFFAGVVSWTSPHPKSGSLGTSIWKHLFPRGSSRVIGTTTNMATQMRPLDVTPVPWPRRAAGTHIVGKVVLMPSSWPRNRIWELEIITNPAMLDKTNKKQPFWATNGWNMMKPI